MVIRCFHPDAPTLTEAPGQTLALSQIKFSLLILDGWDAVFLSALGQM